MLTVLVTKTTFLCQIAEAEVTNCVALWHKHYQNVTVCICRMCQNKSIWSSFFFSKMVMWSYNMKEKWVKAHRDKLEMATTVNRSNIIMQFTIQSALICCCLSVEEPSLLEHSVFWCYWLGGKKGNWVMRYWHGYLSGTRCKWFAYGPADATAMSCFIKIQNGSAFLVSAYPGKKAVKWL